MASPSKEAGNEDYKSRVRRAQWLRAAILGANDGLLSTTSLMLGVGAVKEDRWSMVLSGLAGAVAGACSMAVGEFVSVSTQRDIEKSAEAMPLEDDHNHHEIKLDFTLSNQSPLSCGRSPVMKVMAEEEAKEKDEDGATLAPNPYKAAAASASAFLCGSSVPLLAAILVAENSARSVLIVVVASIALVLCGGIGAHLGGSSVKVSAARVVIGGWMAMGVTYGLLKPFDRDDGKGSVDKD